MSENRSEAHSKLVNQTLLEVGMHMPNITVWKNHTGLAYTPTSVADAMNAIVDAVVGGNYNRSDLLKIAHRKLLPIKFGVTGQCDISGIIDGGHRVEIEVKTGEGVLNEDQKNFKRMIERHGGIHIELRRLSDLDILKQEKMKI